jgi:hypothetical protein
MKVERIQLMPSSTLGSSESKDSGNRVNSAGDSMQHRRNGQQMRQNSAQDESASKDQTGSDGQSTAELPTQSGAPQRVLDITA